MATLTYMSVAVGLSGVQKTMGNKVTLEKLCREFNNTCYYCGSTVVPGAEDPDFRATRDHDLPRSRGGRNAQFNIVLACYTCNQDKAHMTSEEFLRYLRHRTGGMKRKEAMAAVYAGVEPVHFTGRKKATKTQVKPERPPPDYNKLYRKARDGTSRWGYGWQDD